MGGKNEYEKWSKLFKAFGLSVYGILDFDYLINACYPSEKGTKLRELKEINEFKLRHPEWETKIEELYSSGIFILKNGDLEHYLSIKKGLTETIDFCNNKLTTYLSDESNFERNEIHKIIDQIMI